tara:strand:+ start:347 stop:1687 length:1341 start_codon:yes stop_codon:yes gene_type:complete
MKNIIKKRYAFFQNILSTIIDNKKDFGSFVKLKKTNDNLSTEDLTKKVEEAKDEVSAIFYANLLMAKIDNFNQEELADFFSLLSEEYEIDTKQLQNSLNIYNLNQTSENLTKIIEDSEPRRVEIFRRLNSSERGTIRLVDLRKKLITLINKNQDLKRVDNDLLKLFKSWFNPGFLVLKRIHWGTPAHILEKIVKYEAVHEINTWKDLRNRVEPNDRLCFAFFHPSMLDEPLIFVQVALMQSIPNKIDKVLSSEREIISEKNASSAIFYSISNCQPGLKGVSFGNFLIKQVANQIEAEISNIKVFATLSPMPGFMRWIEKNYKEFYNRIEINPPEKSSNVFEKKLFKFALEYFCHSTRKDNLPNDPVARFHLGNGAVIDGVHFLANETQKGISESAGLMVSYKYELENIEKNHERFFKTSEVIFSDSFKSRFSEIIRDIKSSNQKCG